MTADEHRWWEPTQRRLNLAERARLAALIDEAAALRIERDALRSEIMTGRAERAILLRLSLRLRDAWRAARRERMGWMER